MKHKGLIITTISFFLLVNTSYYWEGELGIFSMPALLVLFIVSIVLGIIVFIQLFYAFKEKFKDKQRIQVLGLLTIVLILIFFKPNGLINFDELEGKDILIAQREGAANCMTTFKLKDGNKFIERRVCFGVKEIKGNFKLKDDTIFFENVKLLEGLSI